MKILHTGDFHLRHKHKYTQIVEGRIWDKLFEEKMAILERIPKIATKYEVDYVAIAGDVFDTINPPEAIKAEFCKWLEKFTVPVYIIPGNHEISSFGNHALMDIGAAFIGKRGRSHVFIGEQYHNNNSVGMLHVMVESVNDMYKQAIPMSDERFKNFKTILLGDYHSYWKKVFAHKLFTYCGTPYPTRFGETNH